MATAADRNGQGAPLGVSQQDKHALQVKGESHQDKWQPSSQIKVESFIIKGNSSQNKNLDSLQIKQTSAQQKADSTQVKLHSGELNPQPLPPGAH
jgi:hypothetical protein